MTKVDMMSIIKVAFLILGSGTDVQDMLIFMVLDQFFRCYIFVGIIEVLVCFILRDDQLKVVETDGCKIFLEGLDVLEAVAFAETPQYELRISSKVPNAVMSLEVRLDIAIVFSSQTGACPGP